MKIYKNKSLPVVLYVCYLVPHIKGRTEAKGVQEQPKRKEVCGRRRKEHKEEFHGLYLPSNILRHVPSMWQKKNTCTFS